MFYFLERRGARWENGKGGMGYPLFGVVDEREGEREREGGILKGDLVFEKIGLVLVSIFLTFSTSRICCRCYFVLIIA